MLNVSKLVYYFLLMKTHRNIRVYEINAEIFSEREETDGLMTEASESNKEPEFVK